MTQITIDIGAQHAARLPISSDGWAAGAAEARHQQGAAHRAAPGAARRLCLASTVLLLLTCVYWWVPAAFAQVSREYQLKAVLLLRLAQFTTWPADAFESAKSPIEVCVLGENPFGGALIAAVEGENAHGRPLVVQHHRAVENIKGCHILYLAGAGPRQAKTILSVLGGRSVLSVRDVDGLASAYDTIVGFVTEENRIKLRINSKAATAARLVLDARLLRVGEIVE